MNNWMTSIGITGLVACCGYVAEEGRESLLGVEIHDFGFDRYAVAFATFLLDSVKVIAAMIGTNALAAAGIAMAVVLLCITLLLSRLRLPSTIVLVFSVLFVLLRAPYILVHWQVPTLHVNGFLAQNAELTRGFPADTSRGKVAREVWRDLTCSYDRLRQFGAECGKGDESRAELTHWYERLVLHVLTLVIVLFVFYLTLTRVALRARIGRSWIALGRIVAPIAAATVALTVVMLPYVHAKVMPRVLYSNVEVFLNGAENGKRESVSGYLLHQGDDYVTLYEKIDPKQAAVTSYPVTRVNSIKTAATGSENLLEYHVHRTGPALADIGGE